MRIIVFILFYTIGNSLMGQLVFENLTSSDLRFTKTDELKWWEWKVSNTSCDTVEVHYSIVPSDTMGVEFQAAFNRQLLKDSLFELPPNSVASFVLFTRVHKKSRQSIELCFSSCQSDKTFELNAQVFRELGQQHHCFPSKSSGLFRVYHGTVDYPQVLVMNQNRELLLENTSESPFLELYDYPAGEYIIQIGNDEFIVEKMNLLDSD